MIFLGGWYAEIIRLFYIISWKEEKKLQISVKRREIQMNLFPFIKLLLVDSKCLPSMTPIPSGARANNKQKASVTVYSVHYLFLCAVTAKISMMQILVANEERKRCNSEIKSHAPSATWLATHKRFAIHSNAFCVWFLNLLSYNGLLKWIYIKHRITFYADYSSYIYLQRTHKGNLMCNKHCWIKRKINSLSVL